MPNTSNPLREMGGLEPVIVSDEERPNPSFEASSLPGFKKAVQGRRAIRKFDGDPIPEGVMRDCFKDAILAPSASNLQCYEIYWVRDAQKKHQLAALCLDQPGVTTAGEVVVIVSRVDLWKSHLRKLIGIMTENGKKSLKGPIGDYYEKIVPLLMTTDRFGFHNLKRRLMFLLKRTREPTVNEPVSKADHRIYGHVQASLAAENLMLSLAAHGYESCPMSGVDKRAIGAMLELPTGAEITMVIGAGRGTPHGLFSPRTRLPFDDLVKEV